MQFGEETSEACGEAWNAENACVIPLNCQELSAFLGRLGEDYPCRDEALAVDELCF